MWKDICIEGYSTAKLDDVHIKQKHENGKVTVCAKVSAEAWGRDPLSVTLVLTAPDGSKQTAKVELAGEAVASIVVDNPQLWWPNGYGKQNLYQLDITLENGASILDSRKLQLGLRTIQLKQEPDQWGESFTFVVNGTPLFAKGADWIPADSFPTRITNPFLEFLIKSAADAHMNMLRVWGGGLYESESFYDLCDRYGIMVWQDFTFACGIYPEDDAFAENVRVEAIENVRRLASSRQPRAMVRQ